MKHYAGGYIALVGANSPAGLASRPIRILLADEIDRYGVTQEGDPLKLGIQRTTNFHNRKKVLFLLLFWRKRAKSTSGLSSPISVTTMFLAHVVAPCR